MNSIDHYVTVHILNMPYHADKPYTYYVPADFGADIKKGDFLTVPVGNGRRKEIAVVVQTGDSCDFENIKPVLAVGNARLSLNEELLGLCFFMKEQTMCTIGDAVKAIIPSAAMTKLGEYYFCNTEPAAEDVQKILGRLGVSAGYVYSFIQSKGNVSLIRLKDEFGDEAGDLVDCLVRSSLIIKDYQLKAPSNDRYISYYSLNISESEAALIYSGNAGTGVKIKSAGQRAVLRELSLSGEPISESVLMEKTRASKANLNALAEKKLVNVTKADLYRNPYKDKGAADALKQNRYSELSVAQNNAYKIIEEIYLTHKPKGALLHGVTGSGKTRVIKAAIDLAIADKRSVIILVPEIALTPQTVDIFCGYYGERTAVIHSSLSAGEKYDSWKRIRAGEVDVVIGTRSAIFAPLENIGLIVIDEEQEHTYKSEINPKYLTHDIARYRCASHNALMILASATPSLQSYHKAVSGAYTLIELNERYGEAQLPEVIIADMRGEIKSGNTSPVGEILLRELKNIEETKKQAILFLNRRGYNSFLSCKMCGDAIQCPHCSVSMTYHTKKRFSDEELNAGIESSKLKAANGSLTCHYCGYRTPVPKECPKCGSTHISYMGFGTQYAEQELEKLLPESKIIRMDADTTGKKFAHEELLSKFRAGEANILLGTQMVTKGHDFPSVTLVGIFLADSSLFLDDFRAAERTFAMITQVIGRAGRASDRGIAVIQTFNPESDTIKIAAQQDYRTFYEREIALRKALVFPPFCDIAVFTVTGIDEASLMLAASKLAAEIRASVSTGGEFKDVAVIAFGPFEAPVYKIQNKYRMRMIIKCKLNKRTRELINTLFTKFDTKSGGKLSISVDFNPTSSL